MRIHGMVLGIWVSIMVLVSQACSRNTITLSCSKENDLYRTMVANGIGCRRFGTPAEAITKSPEGSGVLILAEGYPAQTTPMDPSLYEKARNKNLRIYAEFPSGIPGMASGKPRRTQWERAVISSDVFSPELNRFRILAIHDCHFIPVTAPAPDIVIARVAGFDSAVYGLSEKAFPVLFEIPQPSGNGGLLVSTTKLSQFITGRYAPGEAWTVIWKHILTWVHPGLVLPDLTWTPTVKTSYAAREQLPEDVEKQVLKRGIDWYYNARMIVSPAMMGKYKRPANLPEPAQADPDTTQDWPFGHRVGYMPGMNVPAGDGSLGALEGYDAKIFHNGSQAVRWWRRGDCNGEIAGAIGLAGLALQNQEFLATSANIGDWLFFTSMISLGDRADPGHPAYGLSGWNDIPEYCGPGSMDGYAVYYGDDNARVILGMMIAASAVKTVRYDKRILNIILGNLRISGINGFQPDRLDQAPLVSHGWKHYFRDKNISYSPHYQANMWACYLWAYNQTGFDLFLHRAKTAIGMTMAAYPSGWTWTNGIQQERAKMLLPLAWLIRVEDTPKHREWLRNMAGDLLAGQAVCGAIPEEIGEPGRGGFPPPASNEAYGTSETPLIQTNGNRVSDMLYTVDFAFLGLHEASAATGERYYRDAEDRLADFLVRIQIRSEKHPELDGGWFRAFDFNRWEFWASNADAGWGAWSIEAGWTQSWITSVFALRAMNTSIWDLTRDSGVEKHFDALRSQMLPGEY